MSDRVESRGEEKVGGTWENKFKHVSLATSAATASSTLISGRLQSAGFPTEHEALITVFGL